MARQTSSPILAQIRHPRSASEHIIALRALKNEINGHQQKKEIWVGLGIVEPLVRSLGSGRSSAAANGKHRMEQSIHTRPLSDEEKIRLQALCIIGSLANGGPAFLAPLHTASAIPSILANICPATNPPQLVITALRALLNTAQAIALASDSQTMTPATLADALFARKNMHSLRQILVQSSPNGFFESQASLVAALISIICRDERHQLGLTNCGVLDALATRLASVAVYQGLAVPGAEAAAHRDGLLDYFPPPAPRNMDFAVVLEAISVIISESKYRASQLLYSPSLLAVFPIFHTTELGGIFDLRGTWDAPAIWNLEEGYGTFSAIDLLLPSVPSARTSGPSTAAFPPLGSSGSREHLTQLGSSIRHKFRSPSVANPWGESDLMEGSGMQHDGRLAEFDHPESPLFAYLLWLLRSTTGLERLMAAAVLTILYRAGLANKNREITLSLLVVPILVRLLDDNDWVGSTKSRDPGPDTETIITSWTIMERAPSVLAMLITDSEILQKAAHDAGAISKLSKMIKVAYDPVLESTRSRGWSPNPRESKHADDSTTPRMVEGEMSPLLLHKVKMRESTLKAIAALVPFKDEYRKAFIDQGVIPYIVESLRADPGKPSTKSTDKPDAAPKAVNNRSKAKGFGTNSVSVLIAACGAVRALSRSVSILRTTLIDNGVAMPVFDLLQHPDIEVQIAATAAVCNLVTDFSPMREAISDAGVLQILCEHAHSMNARLRLNALWALKHLVLSAGNDVKRSCLEELGQGWLIQLICDDTEDDALLSSRAKSERIGKSFSNNDDENDVEMEPIEVGESEESSMNNSPTRAERTRPQSSDSYARGIRDASSAHVRARLAALRDLETDPERRARKDDIAVQEQGLDFIRNLIGGAGQGGTAETSEMIDFLFSALGQDRVFEILASKLRSKVINPFSKRRSTVTETIILPPQAEIITAVGYILVHMAASVPRHRQLVIAQTELLRLLVPQFNHPSKEVRLALCWLLTNLTWLDDANDGQACAHRAYELKKLGFLARLEGLEYDQELDVRERAKTALWQMRQGH